MSTRILLVTSKSPFIGDDFDGGSVLVSQLCQYIPKIAKLDILFLRKRDKRFQKLAKVNKKYFIEPKNSNKGRFYDRLYNAAKTINIIKELSNKYNYIWIIHLSNCFGIENTAKYLISKLVVFPMFTGDSYIRAGEKVPDDYFKAEMKALEAIPCICSPSLSEKMQLTSFYDVAQNKIHVFPRGIDFKMFHFCKRKSPQNSNVINLLYIATIKLQKNQFDCIPLIKELMARGIFAIIHLVGGIGCHSYYLRLRREISANNMDNNFVFHNTIPPSKIVAIARICHFGISVSKWETFGKGFFEGMATGLPSFAYRDVECIWEYLSDKEGAQAILNPAMMASTIMDIVGNSSTYCELSRFAYENVRYLDLHVVMSNLLENIMSFVCEQKKDEQ